MTEGYAAMAVQYLVGGAAVGLASVLLTLVYRRR